MRCRKCFNDNLADASAELGDGGDSDGGLWMKCFQCGWRGRPITGMVTVKQAKEDGHEQAGRRVCRTPGKRGGRCTGYVLKNQDYCRKCLESIRAGGVDQAESVPAVQVEVRVEESLPAVTVESDGRAVVDRELEQRIAYLRADLAVLVRAQEILARGQGEREGGVYGAD